MGFAALTYRVSAGVAEVILDRPAVLNAYNMQMRDDLWEVLGAAAIDDGVRVLLFTGAGRAFCAGADLTEFGLTPSQAVARDIRLERDVWEQLRSFPKPMVAAIHGFAIGAGLEIALLCDLRIIGSGTFLQLPETSLGMIPAGGATQSLPRAVGIGRALDLVLRGRRLSADEAVAGGFVNRVGVESEVRRDGRRLARRLARLDATLLERVKAAVIGGLELSEREGLRLEARLAALPR